ncbi:DUF3592 domain-containing protein [Streptomyces sp. NY05-11A]|uniref:DUF3592 domain-containing protein n=1 Tax=Streptomyces soliscabiei TaxID=588897 RepID=UPI0029A9268E|nr:DUF3592 domain-containing protein [Streptomyces sp. NY05-11A]MDX2683491.1 DUF3592 domain-containing protein [Streptomyces sp. NY05-11A]
MDGQGLLGLWWTVPAGLAAVGYACSLAGVTRPQRAVWVTARVVEVHQPAHHDSKRPGIPVTVAFQDPATGREFRLRHAGKNRHVVEAAWVGREFPVRYPRGRPERFHLMLDMRGETRGLGGPNCTVFLLLVGLVIQSFFVWGWPRGLICLGGLLFLIAAISRDVQVARARAALLDGAVAVPGRVVAVTRDIYTDGEGDEIINHAPVVAFTTHEGVRVTALCREGIPDPSLSLDRDVTIHYAPADPSVLTPDPDHDRREREGAVGFIVMLLLAGIASVAVGVLALCHLLPVT